MLHNDALPLIEVDPETNECSIAYHNINYTQGVSNGVHGLLVFDDEIYMCLATDNYDGKGTHGGIIVASGLYLLHRERIQQARQKLPLDHP